MSQVIIVISEFTSQSTDCSLRLEHADSFDIRKFLANLTENKGYPAQTTSDVDDHEFDDEAWEVAWRHHFYPPRRGEQP